MNTNQFNSMLGTTEALSGTGYNDFLFVKICDPNGKVICQILEGAGEDYFSSNRTNDRTTKGFPPYMNGIFASENKKIWMFLTEPNWKVTHQDKLDYVSRIEFCKQQHLGPKDKCIILYNKVDRSNYVTGAGKVHVRNAMVGCNNEYEGLFNVFKNNSILPWADKYTFKFVPFCTGIFAPGETVHYTPGHENYPRMLWDTIQKCIKSL